LLLGKHIAVKIKQDRYFKIFGHGYTFFSV